MRKTVWKILPVLLLCIAALTAAGCAKETQQHAVLAVYDNFGREWCRLSEQEYKKEIEIPFDGKERSFRAELFSPNGDVLPQDENPTDTQLVSFVSPDGLSGESPAAVCEAGTYFYWFSVRSGAAHAFPFQAFLTVHITAERTEENEPQPLLYGQNELSLQAGEEKCFSLPQGESISVLRCDIAGISVSAWNKTMTAEYPLSANGNEWQLYLGADKDAECVVKIGNGTANDIANVPVFLQKGTELALGEASAVTVFTEKYFYFSPETDGFYSIGCDAESIDVSFPNMPESADGYYLYGGRQYVVKLSAKEQTSGTITPQRVYAALTVGENRVAGQYLRFVPKVTNTYTFDFPENSLDKIVADGKTTDAEGGVYSAEMEEGKAYCFILRNASSGTIPVYVDFACEELNVGERKNIGLNESGYAFFKVSITENTQYEIVSDFDAEVYTPELLKADLSEDPRWSRVFYYVRFSGSPLADGNAEIRLSGYKRDPGQKITVTQTSYFVFSLSPGTEYTLTSSGNQYDETQKLFYIYDENGDLLAAGEGITEIAFTAKTERILVKVTLEIEGHTIGFCIDQKN